MSLQDRTDSRAFPGRDPANGHFMKGFRGAYRTRQEAVKQRLEALQSAYKATTAADIALLSIAAIHLVDAEKARSRNTRVRATNAAMRALREIPREPEHETIDDVLGGRR
jgi:hypothetical protein